MALSFVQSFDCTSSPWDYKSFSFFPHVLFNSFIFRYLISLEFIFPYDVSRRKWFLFISLAQNCSVAQLQCPPVMASKTCSADCWFLPSQILLTLRFSRCQPISSSHIDPWYLSEASCTNSTWHLLSWMCLMSLLLRVRDVFKAWIPKASIPQLKSFNFYFCLDSGLPVLYLDSPTLLNYPFAK